MDFDPDEIITLDGQEMTVRTAIRRLMASPRQASFTIVRDGRQSVLSGSDIERVARSWGIAPEPERP